LGIDLRYIAVAARDFGVRGEKGGFQVTPKLPGGYQVATDPDGYKYLLVPDTQGCSPDDPFLFVSLRVKNLEESLKFYTELDLKVFKNVPGSLSPNTPGVKKSAVVGFDIQYFKIELVELEDGLVLDHKKGIGRLATETDDEAPIGVAEKVKSSNGKILHGPFKLPPHDEHVVIVADPDGYEYCFVGMTGYRAGSLSVTNNKIDWDHRKKIGTPVQASTSAPTQPKEENQVKVIKNSDEYNKYKNTPGKLVVVDYSAVWCGPCKKIAPIFEKLSSTYKDAIFLKVDIDENSALEDVATLPGVPAFKFFKDNKLVGAFEGAHEGLLEDNIKKFIS
jgi:thiol-disulfide isomerase/thioredoxin